VLALAVVLFSFQIFCDFSGYSDIAIGSARVMGFRLMRNFDSPYQAQSVTEFWRRWHISLSSWFKDYVYIPLGGSRVSVPRHYANVFIVFLLSGLWHGAGWHYVLWGGLHGCFVAASSATRSARQHLVELTGLSSFPRLHASLRVLMTFILISLSWILFRANSRHEALRMVKGLFSGWGFLFEPTGLTEAFRSVHSNAVWLALGGVILVECVQLLGRTISVPSFVRMQPWWMRWSLYYAFAAVLFFCSIQGGDQFIYFQF
jgi:D-alanyl-lipoteichoic acid acyltransferase DltB (MBOAT superfamily)